MRRFTSALLVALVTSVATLAPPVSAGAVAATARVSATTVQSATRAQHLAQLAVLHRARVAEAATLRLLGANARSLRVSIDQLRAEWQHVAICEVGGNWTMTGPSYSGIGFLNATWSHYGGTAFAPVAGLATRDQQILIGMRVTRGWVPDQYGCSPTGW